MIHVYYRYFADDEPYFFDPATNVTTYQFPSDGIVLDPTTLTPVEYDPIENPEYGMLLNAYNEFVYQQQQAAIKAQNREKMKNEPPKSQGISVKSGTLIQTIEPSDEELQNNTQKPPTDPLEIEEIPTTQEPESSNVVYTPIEESDHSDGENIKHSNVENQVEDSLIVPKTEEKKPEKRKPPLPRIKSSLEIDVEPKHKHSPSDEQPPPINADVRNLKRSLTVRQSDTSRRHNSRKSHMFQDPLNFGEEVTTERKKHSGKHRRTRARQNTNLLDIPDIVNNFDENKIVKPAAPKRDTSFFPNSKAPYLPSDIQENIHKFQVEEYAKQYFREHRKGKVFNRKLVSVEQITQFSKEPLEFPLIKSTNQNDEKNAVKCFKLILNYTGVIPVKGASVCADQLVQILTNNPSLYDEVYFQLIKQTRQNPNPDWEIKTWELFLIIATIFPSSRNSEVWIKSHLARSAMSPSKDISNLAQFTYIRFSARCAIGKPKTNLEVNYSVKIPKQVNRGYCTFSASIYEHLWFQRKEHPKFPIPIIVYRMSEAILSKGAETVTGIFRLPGNMKLVQQMVQEIDKGNDPIPNSEIYDLLSLFKLWFRDLPNPTVPVESLPYLKNAYEDRNYLDFVVQYLPVAHLNLLGYLIGFLQKLSKAEETTKMGSKNLAIVFAPNIVQPQVDLKEPQQIKEYSDIAVGFLQFLIENWDCSQYYPLKL
ncbi:RhoGAP domain containing protein [Histomonas meleagridis]|uniref:RhoGAP domain containing protein n=1 Tax=Histomonas meleagridis TaxID=135588 RepID=UPI00355995C4|nr:RhoGAP domain containing protein [Histomonas meleagridis]KAH0800769.1 RhoGAP domain containing protein [Histomonas meleagridis]